MFVKHNNKRNNPWVFHKHISSQQNTKTNETIPGFSTNIYHLNKIQNTTTNETTPGFPTNISSQQNTKHNNKRNNLVEMICLWET
jgi:hypothetical protein